MLISLFKTFFKLGLFTFGGGYAMIANIRELVVEKNKWLDEEELLKVITVAESTPGPIAINMATYVGYKKKGVLGSFFATLGVVLPSLIIIYIISLFLDSFMVNKYVAYAFAGIKCGVSFLIIKAGLTMLKKVEKKPLPLICFGAVFGLMIIFELFAVSVSSVVLILSGGVIGIIAYGLPWRKEETK